MSPAKKAAAKPKPKPSGLACTVSGNHAVDGVAPGGTLHLDSLDRVRRLYLAGHITIPGPDGDLTDGDLVALMEAGY